MQLHINQADGKPYYLQIVQQVRYLVAAGRLTDGEQLPPVRKLAAQLLLNPNTVARAYRELENEGLVTSRRGAGVFVSQSGSPLSQREKTRVLTEKIDDLLAAARQLGLDRESLIRLLKQRDRKL